MTKIGLLEKVKIRKRKTKHTGEYPSDIAKRRLPTKTNKGSDLKMPDNPDEPEPPTEGESATDVPEAAEKAAKVMPSLLAKAGIVLGSLSVGRAVSTVIPKVWKVSGQTIGQGVLTFSEIVTALLTKKKYPKASEVASYGAVGSGAGFLESLGRDVLKILGKAPEGEEPIFNPAEIPVIGGFLAKLMKGGKE